jgi:hypothetical protein
MKKERWYVSVLHLRGRNESTLVSTEVLVSLDGIIGCGKTSFETVIMLLSRLTNLATFKVLDMFLNSLYKAFNDDRE